MNYFQTDNPALAVTLALCGVPAPETAAGPMPILMLYTIEHLRSFGYANMPAMEAAHRARREGKAGKRIFQFQRTETLERVLDGWRKAESAHLTGEPMELNDPNPEDVAKWAFYFNEQRRVLLSPGVKVPTYLAFMKQGPVSKKMLPKMKGEPDHLDVAVQSGSFSAVSIDAPESVKRQIRA